MTHYAHRRFESLNGTPALPVMIYGYIRVSTDKQTTENQRFEILKFADEKKLRVDRWIEETISATKKLSHRKLGHLLDAMQEDDVLIVTELSRLGRSLMEVMSILHTLMEKEVKVFTTKERYELGNNISSKVLAFAFSLSAEIERSMISSRTKEALERVKKVPDGSKLSHFPELLFEENQSIHQWTALSKSGLRHLF